MRKYQQNLRIEGNKVFSYATHVATIDDANGQLIVHGHWSMTTSKHVNYVASEYGLTKVDGDRPGEKEEAASMMRTTSMIAAFGNIFCNNAKDQNDWKLRMMKAGLPGLDVPEDWDGLDEAEKTRRLDQIIDLGRSV